MTIALQLTTAIVLIQACLVSAAVAQAPASAPSTAAINLRSLELAQNQPAPDLKAVLAGKAIPGVVTSKTPSPTLLSIPSLWWISEQLTALEVFGEKFIQEWIAYPSVSDKPGQVDLLVNRQLWGGLDYLQRYEFVNRFSAIARSYGYSTRVYDNPERNPVALYNCDFSAVEVRTLGSHPTRTNPSRPTAITTSTRNAIADQATCKLRMDAAIRARKTNLLGQ